MSAKTTNAYAIVVITNKGTGNASLYRTYATAKGAANQSRIQGRIHPDNVYVDMPTVAQRNIVERYNNGELYYSHAEQEFVPVPSVPVIPENLVKMMTDKVMHIAASWQKICTKMYGTQAVLNALAA